MARSVKALVTPQVLAWARARRRLPAETAAKRASVSTERLQAWESGVDQPTVAQARALARAYGYPLALFYLREPPTDFDPMRVPDFRGHVDADYSPELVEQLRDAWRARAAAVELASELGDELEPLRVPVGSGVRPEELAAAARAALGITTDEQRTWRDPRVAYNRWRSALEECGFVTLQFSGVSLEEARAFSLPAPEFPVVAVNARDAYAGRTFSLFHELAHLLRGDGGVCDEDESSAEEATCNQFAGSFLVPPDALLAHERVRANASLRWSDEDLRAIARDFAVSEEVVLRRLLALGRTTRRFYREKRQEYLARYAERPESSGGGPPVPRRVIARLGRGYVRRVLMAVEAERITLSEAAGILHARLRHFPQLEQQAFG